MIQLPACIRRNPKVSVFLLGLVVAFVATLLETLRQRYMNYLVYTDSTLDFWNGINPYTQHFVDEHGRYFLYTPVFSVLFAPIAFLPKWLGPFVWNLTNYTLFSLSVFTLPKQYDAYKLKIFLFLLLILEQSIFPFQFNIVVAYCFLFAFTLLERGKAFWAVLLIMISATTKVYGIVELLLLFCYQKPFRNLCYATLLGMILLILPVLKTGFDGLLPCYENWWNMLSQHQSNAFYVSLLYAYPLRYVLDYYRIVQLITFGVVVMLFFLQYRRWSDFKFRATILGVLMGWIIVFGDSSETHTYLIALAGYMLWYWLQATHTLFDKVLFLALFVFFGIIPVDVFVPASVHQFLNNTLYIDVYLYALVWCKMTLSLWRE
jgi:Protein of unknown function (DUF2029).